MLDFIAIGLLYSGGRTTMTALLLLSMLPVFWLAWPRATRRLAGLLSFAGTLLVVWAPLFVAGTRS